MGIVGVEQLRDWSLLDAGDLDDQELLCAVAEIVQAQNVLASLESRILAQVDRRELAGRFGATSTGAWLSDSGRVDPGPAKRQVNTALALEALPLMAEQFRLGEISADHASAIAAAVAVIEDACPHLSDVGRAEVEQALVEVALSDTPSRVRATGRELLLALRPDGDDRAAEDTAWTWRSAATGAA